LRLSGSSALALQAQDLRASVIVVQLLAFSTRRALDALYAGVSFFHAAAIDDVPIRVQQARAPLRRKTVYTRIKKVKND
jgi:hypothetical protein